MKKKSIWNHLHALRESVSALQTSPQRWAKTAKIKIGFGKKDYIL